ncbi:MAG: undecaprenyl-diphosphate phosphatase [Pseudomonadota bacterium]
MDPIQSVVLAIVQGISEFLPISSSGHLILVPRFLGWEDQGLAFDAATHVGTATAVLLYFRQDLWRMFVAGLRSVTHREWNADARLAWGVVLGTIPVGLAGLLFKDTIETAFRNPMLVAANLAIFGILLWLADRYGRGRREVSDIQWKDVAIIGAAQALALVPGTSRSGVTMTAALALGLTRHAAARFSFLLSVPATTLAGLLAVYDFVSEPAAQEASFAMMALAVVVSGVTGYLTIHYLLKFIQKVGMAPFMVYRLVLAGVVVWAFA